MLDRLRERCNARGLQAGARPACTLTDARRQDVTPRPATTPTEAMPWYSKKASVPRAAIVVMEVSLTAVPERLTTPVAPFPGESTSHFTL